MAAALMQRVTWRSTATLAGENVLVVCAVVASTLLRAGGLTAVIEPVPLFLMKASLVAVVCQACLYFADLYDGRTLIDTPDLVIRLLGALGAASLCLAPIYLLFPGVIVGRGVFVLSALIVLVLITAWRAGLERVSQVVGPRERILIIGTGEAERELARELLARRSDLGVEIAGFVSPDCTRPFNLAGTPGIVGELDDVPELVARMGIDRVIVSLTDARGKLRMDSLLEMRLNGVRFDHLTSAYEEYTGKIALENLRPSWLVFSEGFRKSWLLVAAKRGVDIGAAIVGLVAAAPLMGLAALAIRLTSHGPVLYHQRRTGQRGQPFMVHKFRSMRVDAEGANGPQWARKNDPRVTRVGGFLRKTRLDETPQLWNVLCGSMSLVGPRPERPEFVEELTREIPFYGQRHAVKPGLTGWAQVKFSYGASVADTMEKLQYDLFYIKNLSILLDLVIIFSTVKTVILRRGAQ